MGEERKRGVAWVMALSAAVGFGVSVFFLVRHMLQIGPAATAGQMYGSAALIGLIAGAVAGLAGWAIAAALTRSAMLRRGFTYALLITLGLVAVDVSAATWIQIVTAITRGYHPSRHWSAPRNVATLPEYRRQMALDREAFYRELRDLGYPRFLSAAALATPEGLQNAHTKITLARATVAKYQALYVARLAELKDSFAKADRLKALDQALDPEASARLEWWKVSDQIMAEQQAVIDDLTIPKARWEVKSGKFLFHAKSDADQFNAHVATLKTLQEKAHTLDLSIAHLSDKADTELLSGS